MVQVERSVRETDRVLLMMRRSIRDKELAVRKSSVRIDERARHLNMDVCSDATLAELVYAIRRNRNRRVSVSVFVVFLPSVL